MDFNEKLRMLIEDLDLTQKQVAQDLNFATSTLGGYVQGSSEPDFETLKRLAAYFHVTPDYLLDIPAVKGGEREAELLRVFRSLSPDQQELLIEMGKVFLRTNRKT